MLFFFLPGISFFFCYCSLLFCNFSLYILTSQKYTILFIVFWIFCFCFVHAHLSRRLMRAFLIKICPLSGVVVVVVVVIAVVNFSHFHFLLKNHKANFNQPWHKATFGVRDSSLFKWWAHFPRGDNYEIAEIHWQIKKIFFSRTTGPISIKIGTNHPWVKGILVYSNEKPRIFPKGDNYKIAKI